MTTIGRTLSFDRVADDYDRTRVIPAPLLDEIARLLAREAHLERGGMFLDAGVGTGRFAAPLARRQPGQIVGVDISSAMMARIGAKTAPGSLSLAQADLRRLPFRGDVFAGALLVHILHLIEDWPTALRDLRRVLSPHGGVLFLGVDQGHRSKLVDFYYERARARRVLGEPLGTAGLAQTLAFLHRPERDGGLGASVSQMDTPRLAWKRSLPVAETLDALARRTYSQMWTIPDDAHGELLAETREYARRTFGRDDANETLSSRFVLHKAGWG